MARGLIEVYFLLRSYLPYYYSSEASAFSRQFMSKVWGLGMNLCFFSSTPVNRCSVSGLTCLACSDSTSGFFLVLFLFWLGDGDAKNGNFTC